MSDQSRPRNWRWWIPLTILVLATGFVTFVQGFAELDIGTTFAITVGLTLLTLALLAAWYVFLSGLPWRARFSRFVLAAALVGLAFVSVRIDGCDGYMHPRLRLAWQKPGDYALGAPPGESRIDLTKTTPHDFPEFMGPGRLGKVAGVTLLSDWSKPPEKVWRQPIGAGWGAFAVVGDYAVTQEQRGEQELTVCYEVATGKPVWSHANNVRFSERMGGDGPRATPTIAGGKVYVLGATGILDCLDGATGKPLWSRDTLGENNLPHLEWAKASSPLLVDDLVVISGGKSRDKSLLAYDAKSGEPRWSSSCDQSSYASPVLATLGGVRQILMLNAFSASSHDPADGKVLWKYDWGDKMAKASQPIALDDRRVLLTCGYAESTASLEVTKTGERWEVKEVWKTRALHTKFTTAIVIGEHAYGLDDGILACVDLATGKRLWKGNRYGHGQVLLVGDLLLVQEEGGAVALVRVSPQKAEQLGRFEALNDKTWNNPALTGPYLLVRNDREAACYKLPLKQGAE
jgi:outer membrane protein assembly factor BamB